MTVSSERAPLDALAQVSHLRPSPSMDLSTSVRPRAAGLQSGLQSGLLDNPLDHALLTTLPREQPAGRVAKSVFSIRSLVGTAADQQELRDQESPTRSPTGQASDHEQSDQGADKGEYLSLVLVSIGSQDVDTLRRR